MSNYMFNDQEMTHEEMLKVIADPNTIVQSLSIGVINRTPEDERGPVNNEGVEISKDLTSYLSKVMDSADAGTGMISLERVRGLMNKSCYILMVNTESLKWKDKLKLKLLRMLAK